MTRNLLYSSATRSLLCSSSVSDSRSLLCSSSVSDVLSCPGDGPGHTHTHITILHEPLTRAIQCLRAKAREARVLGMGVRTRRIPWRDRIYLNGLSPVMQVCKGMQDGSYERAARMHACMHARNARARSRDHATCVSLQDSLRCFPPTLMRSACMPACMQYMHACMTWVARLGKLFVSKSLSSAESKSAASISFIPAPCLSMCVSAL